MRRKIGVLLGLLVLVLISLEVSFARAELDNADPNESSVISDAEIYPIRPNMTQYTKTITHLRYEANLQLAVTVSASTTSTSTTTIVWPNPDDPPQSKLIKLIFNNLAWIAAGTILAAIASNLRYSKLPKPVHIYD
jgi:hypothetical protein